MIFGCKRVNCDEMDGDRPRLPANRNCSRLSRVSLSISSDFLLKICRFKCFKNLGGFSVKNHRFYVLSRVSQPSLTQVNMFCINSSHHVCTHSTDSGGIEG